MASQGKSRWADSAEDAVLEARLKKEKEEKKRLKAEKARKEAEQKAQLEAAQQKAGENGANGHGDGDDARQDEHSGRPAKRRKLTPERGNGAPTAADGPAEGASEGSTKLLRFASETICSCRSVEVYDKLNDIEEGAYGWVSRAKEIATGRVVALKRLKIDPKDRGGLPITGLREIQLLKDCQHRNVVNLQEVVVGEDTSKIEK